MKRKLIIALLLVAAGALFVVGVAGMRADSSAANRYQSRPFFLYNCISCHG